MLEHSIIAILIIFAVLILYFIQEIPIYVTTLLGCLAMALFGVISPEKALSGFSNSAALVIVGMMVLGEACFTTGLAKDAGKLARRFTKSERQFVIAIMIIGVLLGSFLNANLLAPLLLAVVNVVVSNSEGRISRKATYMPTSFGVMFGNNLTTVSSSSALTAMAVITTAGYEEIGLFDFSVITLPATAICIIFYYFWGYRLAKKVWNFPEAAPAKLELLEEGAQYPLWKKAVTLLTLIGVIAAMVMGANFGVTALLGACIVIFTGCISPKRAIQAVDWPTYLIASAALGMSTGLTESGGGLVIAEFLAHAAGPIVQSPAGICAIIAVVATILSNLMSDTATVAIMAPIGLALAQSVGIDAVPVAIAAAVGSKVAVATPVSVTSNSLAASAGYRFKDFLVIGGLMNLIQIVVTTIMLQIIYF